MNLCGVIKPVNYNTTNKKSNLKDFDLRFLIQIELLNIK